MIVRTLGIWRIWPEWSHIALGYCLAMMLTLPVSVFANDLNSNDFAWINRITYGGDTQTIDHYKSIGRAKFLDEQLSAKAAPIPEQIQKAIDQLNISDLTAYKSDQLYKAATATAQTLDGSERRKARADIGKQRRELAFKANQRNLLRAVYSPQQIKEQMVWFWLNHFNVYANRGHVGWYAPSYSEEAIAPNALGNFRDLVLATLKHPAMLNYLDNVRNVKGRINENYARELMELHTLGVDAGYSQRDVQQLALILSGVVLKPLEKDTTATPNAPKEAFFFDSKKHTPGDKVLLGTIVSGGGFDEVEKAVDILINHPACARFITRKLALYWIGEHPSEDLINSASEVFNRTHGDIKQTLRFILTSAEFDASLKQHRFKDPYRFVISSIRAAQDGTPIQNSRLPVAWLQRMNYAPFGRGTPDGYSIKQSTWTGSGALITRFETAQSLGSNSLAKDVSEKSPSQPADLDLLSTPLFQSFIKPHFSEATRSVIAHAKNMQDRNALILSSPEFNAY